MKGEFVEKTLFPCSNGKVLVKVDLMEKTTIEALEASVRRSTGLNWAVTEVSPDRGIISWELLLPIKGGKIHICAQSSDYEPQDIYGFHVEENQDFMRALKQIERL